MGFLDYFRREKEAFVQDPIDLMDNNELQDLIDDTLSKIDLVIKKAEGFLERDGYICTKEDFEFIKNSLEEKGLDLEFGAGIYTISRTIRDVRGSSTNILRKFDYIEK